MQGSSCHGFFSRGGLSNVMESKAHKKRNKKLVLNNKAKVWKIRIIMSRPSSNKWKKERQKRKQNFELEAKQARQEKQIQQKKTSSSNSLVGCTARAGAVTGLGAEAFGITYIANLYKMKKLLLTIVKWMQKASSTCTLSPLAVGLTVVADPHFALAANGPSAEFPQTNAWKLWSNPWLFSFPLVIQMSTAFCGLSLLWLVPMDNDLIGPGMEDRLLGIWVQIRDLNIAFVLFLLFIALYNVAGIGGGEGDFAVQTAQTSA